MLQNTSDSFLIVQYQIVVFFLASLQPLLKQIFIIRIASSSKWDCGETSECSRVGCNEIDNLIHFSIFSLSNLTINEDWNEPVGLWQLVNFLADFCCRHFISRIVWSSRKISELQLNCRYLTCRRVRRPFWCVSFHVQEIHVWVGNRRRRLETWHQTVAKFNCLR